MKYFRIRIRQIKTPDLKFKSCADFSTELPIIAWEEGKNAP